MARGDNNLLFNPPRLTKKVKEITGPKPGHFSFQATRLFLMNDITVAEDDEGDIFSLDQEMNSKGDPGKIGFPRIAEGGLLVASEAGVAFADHEGFVIHSRIPENPEKLIKDPLPGDLLGLHLARHALYCFWQDKSGDFFVSGAKVSGSALDDREWIEMVRFDSSNKPVFKNKGENSMIFFDHGADKKANIFSLDLQGNAKNSWLGSGSFAQIPEVDLIAPAEEGFFALERGKYGDEITLIDTDKEDSLSRKRIRSFIGRGERGQWRGIAAYKNLGALLGVDSVVLFSSEDPGLREEIQLDTRARGFEQIEMNAERILLWRENSSAYLEIPLT